MSHHPQPLSHPKVEELHTQVAALQGQQALVLVQTTEQAIAVGEVLTQAGLEGVHAYRVVHMQQPMEMRQQSISLFRADMVQLLVTTHWLVRGLDFPLLKFVIMYAVAESAEAEMHSAGRAGRAGTKGTVITFSEDLGPSPSPVDLASGRLSPSFPSNRATPTELENSFDRSFDRSGDVHDGLRGELQQLTDQLLRAQDEIVRLKSQLATASAEKQKLYATAESFKEALVTQQRQVYAGHSGAHNGGLVNPHRITAGQRRLGVRVRATFGRIRHPPVLWRPTRGMGGGILPPAGAAAPPPPGGTARTMGSGVVGRGASSSDTLGGQVASTVSSRHSGSEGSEVSEPLARDSAEGRDCGCSGMCSTSSQGSYREAPREDTRTVASVEGPRPRRARVISTMTRQWCFAA